MKLSTLLIILVPLLTVSILSCNKNNDQDMMEEQDHQNKQAYDCTFEQNDEDMDGLIDENERTIMTECRENALTSIAAIEHNLIGEWELIGHGEGWYPPYSQPCGYITVSTEELVFEFTNAWIDTVTTHSWEIEKIDFLTGYPYFRLNIESGDFDRLFINQFCTEYMYGDATPSDGNMHLFKKVE